MLTGPALWRAHHTRRGASASLPHGRAAILARLPWQAKCTAFAYHLQGPHDDDTVKHRDVPEVVRMKQEKKARKRSKGAAPLVTPARDAARRPAEMVVDRDLGPAEPPRLGDIPWGYGKDRITVLAVDPYWMFAYWEVTDGALEQARERAGAAAGDCVLRVYDTTHRLFDGTNAHWHTDIPVYRPANNHYVAMARPGSIFHVDVGVAGPDGAFATIARSGAVEMPRDAVSPDTRVEWMTIMPRGQAPPPYQHRHQPTHDRRPGAVAPLQDAEAEGLIQALAGEGWTRVEWTDATMGGRTVRWVRWTGPINRQEWAFRHVEILLEGEQHTTRWESGDRVVFGPWTVTVSGLDPEGGRRILDRWTMQYSWVTEGGTLRVETAPIVRRLLLTYRAGITGLGPGAELLELIGSSEALQAGASEWRWLGASERRLGGASELGFAGASEWPWMGASERLLAGASEWRRLAASEWSAAGASEWQAAGGAAWSFPGASERFFPGASERGFPGASERGIPEAGERPPREGER